MAKDVTVEERNKILAMVVDGTSYRKIALKMGRDRDTISRVCKPGFKTRSQKECAGCLKILPRSLFPVKNNKRSNLCKICLEKSERLYYEEHKDEILVAEKERKRERAIRDKEIAIHSVECTDRARAIKGGAWVGPLKTGYRERIQKEQNNLCYYCGCDLSKSGTNLEHKTPLSRGGKHSMDNMVISCPSCNRSKHSKTEEEYASEVNAGDVDAIYLEIKDIIKDMNDDELYEYVRVNYVDI